MYPDALTRVLTPLLTDPSDGGGGGGTPAPAPSPGPPPTDDTLTYTRQDLTRLISGRINAALDAERRRLGLEGVDQPVVISAADKARFDEMVAAAKTAEQKQLEAEGNYQAALASKERSIREEYDPKLAEREAVIGRLTSKLSEALIDGQIAAAAAKFEAMSVDQVRFDARITSRVKLDPKTLETVVYEPDGKTPMFIAGAPATIEQLVKSHLDTNPNLVKATAQGSGGGASGGRGSAGTPTDALLQAAEAARDQYQKTRSLADLSAFRAATEALHAKQDEAGTPRTRL